MTQEVTSITARASMKLFRTCSTFSPTPVMASLALPAWESRPDSRPESSGS